jgi:hypothetical protein
VIFLGECLWLVSRELSFAEFGPGEQERIESGLHQWRGDGIAGVGAGQSDPHHSPLWYLVGSAALWAGGRTVEPTRGTIWIARAPYIVFGLLLGASLWYVSRRLYGNAGGFIALTLYCFSPGILRSSTLWLAQPEMGAGWGSFGAVFTAIAVSHTLYAPREVVLWNWRRILLLGTSLALAVGSQFSLVVLVPMALAFMLYVANKRRAAALGIWAAACVVALLLVAAAYGFNFPAMGQSFRHADWLGISWPAYGMSGAYLQVLQNLEQNSLALVIAVPAALVAYAAWPRARYFGNTAPLIVAGLFLILGVGTPHTPGLGFQLMALPFLFVFVSGVIADLLETRHRYMVAATTGGLLASSALLNLMLLTRLGA